MLKEPGKPNGPDPTKNTNKCTNSPRSLQNRNTKNLSLPLEIPAVSTGIALSTSPTLGSIPELNTTSTTRPILTSTERPKSSTLERFSRDCIARQNTQRPTLLTRRSEASIYSYPSISKPVIPSTTDKISKINTLALSVNTKSLSKNNRTRSQTVSGLQTSTPVLYNKKEADAKTLWVFPERQQNDTQNNTTLGVEYPDVFKKNAYPDGPLMVLPPNIYLYSEPTLHEILEFDIVINVAEEIENLGRTLPPNSTIQYYHFAWSHVSKISEDLEELTNIMHNAALQGKKILIHCQCGVSRSASLIVAYIMRYEKLGLNDAYNKLKETAPDISPNMGLIFQLMEWNEFLQHDRSDSDSTINNTTNEEEEECLQYDVSAKSQSFNASLNGHSTSPNNSSGSSELTPKTPGDYFKSTAKLVPNVPTLTLSMTSGSTLSDQNISKDDIKDPLAYVDTGNYSTLLTHLSPASTDIVNQFEEDASDHMWD